MVKSSHWKTEIRRRLSICSIVLGYWHFYSGSTRHAVSRWRLLVFVQHMWGKPLCVMCFGSTYAARPSSVINIYFKSNPSYDLQTYHTRSILNKVF